MLNIGNYTNLIQVLLVETGKYFLLFLLVVLAIRLWRHVRVGPAASRPKGIALAGVITTLAAVTGYLSFNHSMARLYLFYSRQAFDAGHLEASATLFDTSARYWSSAGALEGEGVCLLLAGNPKAGWPVLQRAATLSHNKPSAFALYHEGVFCHFSGKPQQAQPLLQAVLADPTYRWHATKLLALQALDEHRLAEAGALMQPFATVKTAEVDHAYIMASLAIAAGRTNAARAVLAQFSDEKLSSSWLPKFAMLRQQLK